MVERRRCEPVPVFQSGDDSSAGGLLPDIRMKVPGKPPLARQPENGLLEAAHAQHGSKQLPLQLIGLPARHDFSSRSPIRTVGLRGDRQIIWNREGAKSNAQLGALRAAASAPAASSTISVVISSWRSWRSRCWSPESFLSVLFLAPSWRSSSPRSRRQTHAWPLRITARRHIPPPGVRVTTPAEAQSAERASDRPRKAPEIDRQQRMPIDADTARD